MTTNHSPLPWRAKSFAGKLNVWPNRKGPAVAYDTSEQDAALIVRAVNAHAELVDALECLLASVEGHRVTVGDCNQAKHALAKAKGEQ